MAAELRGRKSRKTRALNRESATRSPNSIGFGVSGERELRSDSAFPIQFEGPVLHGHSCSTRFERGYSRRGHSTWMFLEVDG